MALVTFEAFDDCFVKVSIEGRVFKEVKAYEVPFPAFKLTYMDANTGMCIQPVFVEGLGGFAVLRLDEDALIPMDWATLISNSDYPNTTRLDIQIPDSDEVSIIWEGDPAE